MAHRKREKIVSDPNKALIKQLTPEIMAAVKETGVLVGADDTINEYAESVISGEVKAFCDGRGAYGDTLRAIGEGTEFEGEAISMLVAKCTKKIALFVTTGIAHM